MLSLIRDGTLILTARERLLLPLISVALIMAGTLEVAALSSAVPLVSLIMAPEIAETNVWISRVSTLIGAPPVNQLIVWLGIGVAVMLITGVAVNLTAQFLVMWFGSRVAARIADNLFAKCLNAPYVWFLHQNGPKLAQYLTTDPTSVGTTLYPGIMQILYSATIVLFATIIIIVSSPWQSTLAIAVIVAIATAILSVIRPCIARYSSQYRDLSIENTRIAIDAVAGVKELKVKARQDYFRRLRLSRYIRMLDRRVKLTVLQQSVPISILLIAQLGLVSVALSLHASGMSPAEMSGLLAMFVLMTARLVPAISRAFGMVNKIVAASPYIRGFVELNRELDSLTRHQVPDAPFLSVDKNWQSLTFNRVSFSYPNSKRSSLRAISLTFRKAKAYGIVGPSGAGKSTLINILLGLHWPQEGTVLLDNTPLGAFNPNAWVERVGLVPQSPVLLNDTLRRNVAFGIDDKLIDDRRVLQSLALADLSDTVESLEDGIDTLMGDRGVRFSGGQAQRVALARAMYDDPDILVLDEATSALDTLTEQALRKTIAALSGHVTTITIAHRLSTIEDCDWIYVLDNGELVEEGSYEDLRIGGGLFSSMSDSGAVKRLETTN